MFLTIPVPIFNPHYVQCYWKKKNTRKILKRHVGEPSVVKQNKANEHGILPFSMTVTVKLQNPSNPSASLKVYATGVEPSWNVPFGLWVLDTFAAGDKFMAYGSVQVTTAKLSPGSATLTMLVGQFNSVGDVSFTMKQNGENNVYILLLISREQFVRTSQESIFKHALDYL